MTSILLGLVVLCGLVNFVCSILILRCLSAQGIRIGFYELRWQVHKHLKTYKKVSLAESGRVGLPYYIYWGSLGGLMLCGGLLVVWIAN